MLNFTGLLSSSNSFKYFFCKEESNLQDIGTNITSNKQMYLLTEEEYFIYQNYR